jgi:hypothetical protein
MPSADDRPPERGRPPADEVAAHAFADGYGEGLKDGLRDILQHASRGHTAQELRWLIESRLARVPEEVAMKRRALLGPPRRVDWESVLRPPGPGPTPTLETALPGTSVLFADERPERARSFAAARWRPFGRVLQLGRVSDEPLEVPEEALERIAFGGGGAGGGEPEAPSPGEIAGRLDALLRSGPALVFLDGLAVQVREEGIDPTQRFLEWLVARVRERSGLLVTWVDPTTLKELDFRRLRACVASVR